jgi:antitoxin (DNA-binding transcriptional repressor) of toxin-antitoxin stability system
MKFVSVRELRGRPGLVWKALAAEKELVLTSNGKPIAILSSVGEDSFEEALGQLRRARAVEAASRLQGRAQARFPRALSPAEVTREIAAARKHRPR